MAKKIYFGVGGKARKVKKVYIGVGGKARKVKRAYIGVGGKARLFWSGGGEIVYYGEVDGIYKGNDGSISNVLSATNKNYLVIGTGYEPGDYSYSGTGIAIAFNKSLTKQDTFIHDPECGGSTGTDDWAFFAGGFMHRRGTTSAPVYDVASAIDPSLTKHSAEVLSMERKFCCGANISGYLLIAGGCYGNNLSSTSYTKTVDVYNSSLTKLENKSLSENKERLCSVNTEKYAIFAGGYKRESGDDVHSKAVDCFNSSLTLVELGEVGISRITTNTVCAAFKIGKYALFHNGDEYVIFNESLTASYMDDKITGFGRSRFGSGVSFDDIAIVSTYGETSKSYVFDESLTKIEAETRKYSRSDFTCGRIGDYAIYAGGSRGAEFMPSEVYALV